MDRGVKLVAGLAIVAVLVMFILPSVDLPETVKVNQDATTTVLALALLMDLQQSAREVISFASAANVGSDLPTRNHSLRI